MNADSYIMTQSVLAVKRQPSYNIMFFIKDGMRRTLGIDDNAFAIVSRCDGTRTLSGLISELSEQFEEPYATVASKVEPFVERLESSDLVSPAAEMTPTPIKVQGRTECITPEYVVLEMTHRCPLKCVHCYLDAGNGPSVKYEKLLPVLEELTERIGIRGIQLTGGEPFLHPDVHKVINYLVEKKIDIQVTTSGLIFNEKVRSAIDNMARVRSTLQVSVDGLRETHNAIRGNRNSFENAMATLDYAVRRKVQTATATSLLSQSREEIFTLCGRMKEMGVRYFRLGAVSIQGRAEQSGEVLFTTDSTLELIDDLREDFQDDSFRVGPVEEMDLRPEEYNCGAGSKLICLDPLLNVRPCPMIAGHIGNLREQSILDVMKNAGKHLSSVAAPCASICGTCTMLSRCHGCIAEGNLNANNVDGCKWFRREQNNLSPLSGMRK